MADLYGSMSGARTAGLVGHEEMAAQIQTGSAVKTTGTMRMWVKRNGDFEVYLADGNGENGLLVAKGNVGKRTVSDAAGNPISVSPLAHKLEPIIVRNRGKAFAKKTPAAKAVTPTGAGSGPGTSPQDDDEPKKAKATRARKIALEKLDVGDRVVAIAETKKWKAGEEGTVENIRPDTPAGPAITVLFDESGPQVAGLDEIGAAPAKAKAAS